MAEIDDNFRAGSHQQRCVILDSLTDAAAYLPKQVLSLIHFAMQHPDAIPDSSEEWSELFAYSHNSVLRRLPKLLERIGYSLNYLPTVCGLLWELGRDDSRLTNLHPEHGMRILAGIAGYDLDKPLAVNYEVVQCVRRWLQATDAFEHEHSLLDILDPILAKEDETSHAEGAKLVMQFFPISWQQTQQLRETALSLLATCIDEHDQKPRVLIRVVQSLLKALAEPYGMSGRGIPAEERESWLSQQTIALSHLAKVIKQSSEPFIQLEIAASLKWHILHAHSADLRARALMIANAVPDNLSYRLAQSLGTERCMDTPDDYLKIEGARDRRQKRRESVALEFVQANVTPEDGLQLINETRSRLRELGVVSNPDRFFQALASKAPAYVVQMAEILIAQPENPLTIYLCILLDTVRALDQERALNLIDRAVRSENESLRCAIALTYQNSAWLQQMQSHEYDNIRLLLGDNTIAVRLEALRILKQLAKIDQSSVIAMALQVNIEDSSPLAEELCELFDSQWGIPLDQLTDTAVGTLLSKLEPVTNLDDYHICSLISVACSRLPRLVVDLLCKRVNRADDTFQPLPYAHNLDLQGLFASEDYSELLREIRDHALVNDDSWHKTDSLRELFKRASFGFAQPSLDVLREWIDSGDPDLIVHAGSFLKEAPRSFIFAQKDFVCHLLEQAGVAGAEYYGYVKSYLFASAAMGSFSGIPGQPFPEHVDMLKQATETEYGLVPGSLAHQLYAEVADHARRSIRTSEIDGEELLG